MAVKKTPYQSNMSPVTREALAERLVTLADKALLVGYPFTAQHFKHLAAFFINEERAASKNIARERYFSNAFNSAYPASKMVLLGRTTEVST